MLNAPPGCVQEWWELVWQAWCFSKDHHVETALNLYQQADDALDGYEMNPGLSVRRHNNGLAGASSGTVRPVPPTEDAVVSCFLPPLHEPATGSRIVGVPAEEQMAFQPFGDQNGRPHVMVLSSGRCGTVSLFRLFQGSNLEPYHTYWWMVHPYTRWEFMCRLAACRFNDNACGMEWICTRAAECLGEKPMIGLNHSDTVYAPVFAANHPKSRFVYLRRNPEAVFKSFVQKGQWSGGMGHFRPVMYDFGEGYSFSLPEVNEVDGTRWHLDYTEAFCCTFGRVMGDRFIEISSDRLFGRDREEISKLLEFVGSDIDLDSAVDHFATKINEKVHKTA